MTGPGNPYIASVVTTLDQNTANQQQMKTEQTLDTHGNLTQYKIYDFGNLSTPAPTRPGRFGTAW